MAKKEDKLKLTKEQIEEVMKDYTRCTNCGHILKTNVNNFYTSYSSLYADTGRLSICKNCLTDIFKTYINDFNDIERAIFELCRRMDYVFIKKIYDTSENEAKWNNKMSLEEKGISIWKKYMKNITSLPQYKGYTFKQGETNIFSENNISNKELGSYTKIEEPVTMGNNDIITKNEVIKTNIDLSEEELQQRVQDKKNKEDVIRIIGYDPFENELELDKSKMYAKMVNMLSSDEDGQKDEMKITGIIEIIKSQNQVNKINDIITSLSSDMNSLKDNIGTIKSLTDTKEKLGKSAMLVAKDNKLTDFYSGNKSPGAGTLTGMVKKLKELDLNEAQVNLFDIQTSLGMLQVARLSNKAIVENLNFGDDDLLDMVKFQKGKMEYYEKEYSKLKEENRRIKVICDFNNIDYHEAILDTEYKDILEYGEEEQNEIKDDLEAFNNMVKEVKPLNTIEYADKIIKDKEEIEKQKILDSIK